MNARVPNSFTYSEEAALLSCTNYLTVSSGCSANYGKDNNRERMRCVCIMSLPFTLI